MSHASTGPLRVLYSFPHPLGSPGIGTTALNQVRGLVGRGALVSVYCTSASEVPSGLQELVETMVVARRRVPHRVLGVDRAYRHHDRRVASALRRYRDRFDIVHTWPLGAECTLTAARRTGVTGVREAPNSHAREAYRRAGDEAARIGVEMPGDASHRFNEGRLRLEEREYALADAVLVPSGFVESTFASHPGPEPRVIRHSYGFDPSRFPAPHRDRPDRPFTLVFLGSLEPRKGLHLALDAWGRSNAAADGAVFRIRGRAQPEYQRYLQPLLRQPGVDVQGFTNDAGTLLRDADALVLPSVEEGSALVTYEAQASGCALLVSDASGALMVHGAHGLRHRAGDVDALAADMRRLVHDRALLDRMRGAVIEHRGALTWSAAAARLEAAYRAALDLRS